MGGKVQGIRSIIGRHKIDEGAVKSGIANREIKELICTNHGHELRAGNAGGLGSTGRRGDKGEKKIGKTNSIINKIYLKIIISWKEVANNAVLKGHKQTHGNGPALIALAHSFGYTLHLFDMFKQLIFWFIRTLSICILNIHKSCVFS